MQLKFSDYEERLKIWTDVYTTWEQLGLPASSPARAALLDVLNHFVGRTDGHVYVGTIVVPGLDNKQLEYVLPGRRVLKPFVRLAKR